MAFCCCVLYRQIATPDDVTILQDNLSKLIVLYRQIATPDDVINLQGNLSMLVEWCEIWQMQLNTEKYKHFAFSMLSRTLIIAYAVNGTVIGNVTRFKYLGTSLTSDHSWQNLTFVKLSRTGSGQ